MLIQAQVDAAKGVEEAWTKTKNAFNMRPQMIVFILSDKNTFHYLRVKKSADCRFGIMTQCRLIQGTIFPKSSQLTRAPSGVAGVQAAHCQKSAPQYLSNVCMKFNAKLGGSTSRVAGVRPDRRCPPVDGSLADLPCRSTRSLVISPSRRSSLAPMCPIRPA